MERLKLKKTFNRKVLVYSNHRLKPLLTAQRFSSEFRLQLNDNISSLADKTFKSHTRSFARNSTVTISFHFTFLTKDRGDFMMSTAHKMKKGIADASERHVILLWGMNFSRKWFFFAEILVDGYVKYRVSMIWTART